MFLVNGRGCVTHSAVLWTPALSSCPVTQGPLEGPVELHTEEQPDFDTHKLHLPAAAAAAPLLLLLSSFLPCSLPLGS